MAAVAYNADTYMSLTSLGDALDRFDNSPSQAVLDKEISDLFERYDDDGVANVFGICLLHRHFDIEADEILVEHGLTSTPWPIPLDSTNSMYGRIVPHGWRFSSNDEDELTLPQVYEFRFEPLSDRARVDLGAYRQFVAELKTILQKHSLTSILGLVALPPGNHLTNTLRYEKTFGRANLVFEAGPEILKDKDKRTSVWVFRKGIHAGQEAMLCISGCLCSRSL